LGGDRQQTVLNPSLIYRLFRKIQSQFFEKLEKKIVSKNCFLFKNVSLVIKNFKYVVVSKCKPVGPW
jgi:hypothetical protein